MVVETIDGETGTKIDWNKVPVDTPVYVRDRDDSLWRPRYFKGLEGKKFLTWGFGCTSFSAEDESVVVDWKQCILANEEDIKKYRL